MECNEILWNLAVDKYFHVNIIQWKREKNVKREKLKFLRKRNTNKILETR